MSEFIAFTLRPWLHASVSKLIPDFPVQCQGLVRAGYVAITMIEWKGRFTHLHTLSLASEGFLKR